MDLSLKRYTLNAKINSKELLNIVLILIYKFTFDLVYIFNISKIYGYTGFTFNFNLFKYLIITTFFFILVKPISNLFFSEKLSSLAILFFTLIYFIPGLTYISFVDVNIGYIIFYLLYILFMFFWNSFLKSNNLKLIRNDNAKLVHYLFVFFCIILVLYVSWKYTGFNISFNFVDVYQQRAKERMMVMSTLISYSIPIVSAINPILLIFYLIRKNYLVSIIIAILQLLLFGIGGHKSLIVSIFIAYLIYLFYRSNRKKYILYVFILINFLALLQGAFNNGNSIVASFIVNRVQLTPNQISFYIYDFMQSNELLYLRESIMRFFGLNSPYDRTLPFVIGEVYYHDSFTRSNTGACGDAYSQFGFISFLFYSLLIPLTFNFVEIVSKKIDARIGVTVVFLYVNTFINGSFFSVFLTNGLLITILLLYILTSSLQKNA